MSVRSKFTAASRFWGNMRGGGLRNELLRGGFGSVAVKVGHTVLALFVAVLLARSLGPAGYGTYSFIFAVLMVGGVPILGGLPPLAVRETARANAYGRPELVKGMVRWSNAVILLYFLGLLGVSVLLFRIIPDDWNSARVETLLAGSVLLPILAVTRVRGAMVRGLRHVTMGQISENIIRPACFASFLVVGLLLVSEDGLTPAGAMGFHVVAACVGVLAATSMLNRLSTPAVLPHYRSWEWACALGPLALTGGFQVMNKYLDILILGMLGSDDSVGVYRVVIQLGVLVIFGLQAINQVLQPHFSRLHMGNDTRRLQRLVTVSTRLMLFSAFFPFILFVFFGQHVLDLVFGDAYVSGASALAIIAVGQLVNAAIGPVGMLLNMTGNERDTMWGLGFAAITNIFLNFILIPLYGIEGAATASTVTVVLWNFLLRIMVKRRLGIETTFIGAWPSRPRDNTDAPIK